MQSFTILDGKFSKEVCLSPDNRSFRYGDGFFETMRMVNGEILLKDLHFKRAFETMAALDFKKPNFYNAAFFQNQIEELARRNKMQSLARLRLTFFRGNGGMYDETDNYPHYIIQTCPLNSAINSMNSNGMQLGIVPGITKNNDSLSSLKSNNFLCYAMAAAWVKQNKLNDGLLLNPFGKVADATIANIFIEKDGVLMTPPLTDGPVNGVMRRYLIETFRSAGIKCIECSLDSTDVLQASEVFLTNAIYGIKWVKQVHESTFTNTATTKFYSQFIKPLFKL